MLLLTEGQEDVGLGRASLGSEKVEEGRVSGSGVRE